MKKIIELALPKLIEILISMIKPEKVEKLADKALDWCEEAVKRSDNEYDDAIIIPLLNIIREAFEIKDND